MKHVVLDRQHAGKPGSRDQGAVFADGTTEAQHAMWQIENATPWLEASGVKVSIFLKGHYPDRNRAANAAGADLYVACHVNAGGGHYALTEYVADRGNVPGSRRAAETLLRTIDDELGQKAVGPWALRSGDRGHVCVAACSMPAVIFEPYFVENRKHDPLVGIRLAQGICDFFGVPLKTPGAPLQEDDDMGFRYDSFQRTTDKKIALHAPGYFKPLVPEEWEVFVAKGLADPKFTVVNEREWDVIRAGAFGGEEPEAQRAAD